jgi:hypothetical protein
MLRGPAWTDAGPDRRVWREETVQRNLIECCTDLGKSLFARHGQMAGETVSETGRGCQPRSVSVLKIPKKSDGRPGTGAAMDSGTRQLIPLRVSRRPETRNEKKFQFIVRKRLSVQAVRRRSTETRRQDEHQNPLAHPPGTSSFPRTRCPDRMVQTLRRPTADLRRRVMRTHEAAPRRLHGFFRFFRPG